MLDEGAFEGGIVPKLARRGTRRRAAASPRTIGRTAVVA